MSGRQRNPEAEASERPAAADVSKSERKRQAQSRQALGRRLAELAPERRAALPLPEDLRRALEDYRRFGSHGARRRQLQYIGRLMRDLDVAPVEAALDTLDGHSTAARREFHDIERWRERLLDEPDALTGFLAEHPHTDAQQLRHHIAHVQKATTDQQQRAAARALFRFLREAVHPA